MPTTALETERLALDPLVLEDALALVPLADNINVSKWTASLPHPYTEADAHAWIESIGADDHGWTIREKAGATVPGGPIGAIGLRFPTGPGTANLGYWLGEPYWGKGYATEAARTVVDFAFATLKAGRVRAGLNPENRGSRRIFEKLGLRFAESVDEHIPARGRSERTDYYELEAAAWR